MYLTLPLPLPPTISPNRLDSLQLPIFIEKSQFSHQLHHHQKKYIYPKNKNCDKFTFYYPPAPEFFTCFPIGFLPMPWFESLQFFIFIENRIFCVTSTTTQKTHKKITIYDKVTFHYPPAPDNLSTFLKIFLSITWIDSIQLPIFIEKLHFSCHLKQSPKNRKIQKLQ